jgi:hypothetical protein
MIRSQTIGAIRMTDASTERVMVDLETLGLDPGAAILSIGAVRFDVGGVGEEFYRSVSLSSCQDAGLSIDAGTLEWWLDQDEAVRGVLRDGHDLKQVLFDFETFYDDAEEIWAFSPSFDCEILGHAYEAVGMDVPWSYRDERDARTLASLPIWPDIDQDGDEHDALDDARYQARQTVVALQALHDEIGSKQAADTQ